MCSNDGHSRVWVAGFTLLTALSACGGDPEPVSPLLEVDEAEDEVVFVPPEPPELGWYDLPTDRREREALEAARVEEGTKRAVAGYVDTLVATQAHTAADGLMGPDGLAWFEALGDRSLMDGVLVDRRATGRGIAAACLLLALDDGHVTADRRSAVWNALDRVAGMSFDWPEATPSQSRSEPEVASSWPTATESGIIPKAAIASLGGSLRTPAMAVVPQESGARAEAERVLTVMGRIEAETGLITIPREPDEGWNPRSKRLFDEMPRVLRRIVDTDEIRALVSSHAEMRGW